MRTRFLALAALALPLTGVWAAPADVDFSATAVQTMPQRGTMTGKLYVSKSKMRQEAVQEGQTRITITDGEKNTSWILNPDRKEYVELKGPGAGPAAAGRPPMPDEAAHPCQQKDSGLKCSKLGSETVNGRATDKWEVIAVQGKDSFRSVMWVDQRLRTPIRAEFQGGAQSELRDVTEGPQPADLFVVPADYKKVELPQRPPQGQAGAPAAPPR